MNKQIERNFHMKKTMKKVALALIISSLLASMASCGEDSSSSSGSKDNSIVIDSSSVSEDVSANSITAEEFKNKILEKVAFDGGMTDCTKIPDYPLDTHGIPSEAYSSYVYVEVSDPTNSYETVIVFSAKDTDLIKKKLDDYISGLKAQFENYNATIIEMVNKSVVKVNGNKVYLIISPNVNEIEKVVVDNLKAFN